ncbi:MAG: hypothetical protein KJO07_25015 [Deltaproteobacteria bacterium]|nr:hypothetical protein [Deltaproteobacteria bacterium]
MRVLASLAMVALLGACGGDDGGVTLEGFPERAVRSYCQNAADCGLFPDTETCLETQELIDVQQALADAEAGLLEPDLQALAECASVEPTCDRQFNTTAFDVEQIQSCIDSVRGTLPDGEACTAFSQCAGGVCSRPDTCDPNDACCQGTCATGVPPLVDEGQECLFFSCNVGLYCALETDGMNFALVCRSQVQPGQACGQPNACTDGNFCNFPNDTDPGVCDPVAGPGEACDGASESRNFGCSDYTTYCDVNTNTCEPRSEAGEPCDANLTCLLYASCDGTTCQTRPLEGDACNAESGPRCLGDLECLETGVCGFEPRTSAPICSL